MEQEKLALLSRGFNSQIYRYGSLNQAVVLKMVPTSCTKETKHLKNQYHILNSLKHQNIIKVHKYKQKMIINGTGVNKQLEATRNVLVIQNALHGSLLDFYKKNRPTMNQIRWIFSEICEATLYLHCNYIVHRDLKLENVLVSQNDSQIQIKLADFGFACSTKESRFSNAYKGTKRGFMAPQIHKVYQNPQKMYDMQKADIFALGVILFTLVMGKLPFEYARSTDIHYRYISEVKFNQFWAMHQKTLTKIQELQDSNLQDFKQIFQDMVQEDANSRPTIQKVFECSWLSGKQQIMKSRKNTSQKSTIVIN